MNTTNSLIAVVLLLAANGFFVAAEFALVKARGFRVASIAEGGSASARLTLKIQANLESYLAACQLGITMASLGLGWVGEPAVAALLEPVFHSMGLSDNALHTASFITGFLIFSSLHIVVGEQVPKTFAIRQPEPVAIWTAYPLHFTYILVWPLNYLLNKTSSSILSLFGVAEATHGDVLSGEEIRGVVDTSEEHGELHQDRALMLRNLLDFDQRQVSRVLMPRTNVNELDLNAAPETNLEIIKTTAHSRFPVVDSSEGDRIVGMLLVKDLQKALLDGEPEPWKNLAALVRDVLVVPEHQPIALLFQQMRTSRAHMTLVIDEYGSFIGIVTLEDLLEEIVGEIHDENDMEEVVREVVAKEDGVWEVGGLVSIDDLHRIIGIDISSDADVNTLSGLFMDRLGRVPLVDDEITEANVNMRVLSVEEHRVGKAVLRQLREAAENQVDDSTPDNTETQGS